MEKVAAMVDFESFRPLLEELTAREVKGPGGRPRFDPVMMFKILLLQQWNNLADAKTEFLVNDRLSFQRFLGLSLGDPVPDATTIWLFREHLGHDGCERLFAAFGRALDAEGMITRAGSIVDATFVEAPRQHNSAGENLAIKRGQVPDGWDDPAVTRPAKRRQKDANARWAVKRSRAHYGYKNHVKIDADSKLIIAHRVTHAAVHDSRMLAELVDGQDQVVWADSGYSGQQMQALVTAAHPGVELRISRRASRNRALTSQDEENNRAVSRVRCRVEHVFGHIKKAMGGSVVTQIGLVRAKTRCVLRDLAYNIHRAGIIAPATRITASP